RVSASYDTVGKQVTFTARQVQPRDSLTGLFDVPVDVAVFTDHGVVHGIVNVHGEESSATIPVDGTPRGYRWDVGHWILQVYDFPRSTSMLAYQLQHDTDVAGRLEAVRFLHNDPSVATAARNDPDWGVRAAAAAELTDAKTLVAMLKDRDSRVRTAAVRALATAGTSNPDVVVSLKELVATDSSLFVRGNALTALAKLDTTAAMPMIRVALGVDSWTDVERTAALHA